MTQRDSEKTGPTVFHDRTGPLRTAGSERTGPLRTAKHERTWPRWMARSAPAGPTGDAATSALAASNKAALSDGLALSISGAVGSLAGFVSWLLAARIMPQASVGYAAAFVSAFLLVAGVAQLNLDSAMMLWMPRSGRRAPALYWRSHAVIIPACGVVALLYIWLFPSIARDGSWTGGPLVVGIGLFVIASIGWGLWGVHDYSLIAVGRTWWAPYRNIAFAVARIGLLVALGASLGSFGIVLSWVIPIFLWGIVSAGLGGWATSRFARRAQEGWVPRRAEVVKFLGPTTVGHWGTVLLFNQVTVMVTERFGPVPGAAFFIAWQAVMVIDIAAQRFMQSLSAQLARDPSHAEQHVRASRRRLFVIFVPIVVAGILAAEIGLRIFGPGYAEAANVLRVLLIGAIPRLLIAHELGRRQAAGDGMGFARLQLVSTLLVIAVVLFVPIAAQAPGSVFPVAALMPVAIGYTATQVLCALAVIVLEVRRRAVLRRTEVPA